MAEVCPCITWIIEVSRHLGRATEVAWAKEWEPAKSLASLSDYLLDKEVRKCFPVKEVKREIKSGLEFLEEKKHTQAGNAFYSAVTILDRKAREACE